MRERANEIHKLQSTVNERDEHIAVLDNQMELLRRQLMATRNGIANGSPKAQHDTKESRETQTSVHSGDDVQSNASSGRGRRRKRWACSCFS